MSFAYFSNIGMQTIAPGASVQFNQQPLPAVLPVDIAFVAPSQIVITTPGIYEFSFYALPWNSDITLALYIDGVEAPLTRYTTVTSAGVVYGQALINVALVPAVITLVNVDSSFSATLADGERPNTVNASLMVSKLTE